MLAVLLNIFKCSLLHGVGEYFLLCDVTKQLQNDVMFDNTGGPTAKDTGAALFKDDEMMVSITQLL